MADKLTAQERERVERMRRIAKDADAQWTDEVLWLCKTITRLSSGSAGGFADGVEAAAKLVEENQQTFSSGPAGRHLTKRSDGNMDGMAYATAIRALTPKEK